jgi:hypothetical protein
MRSGSLGEEVDLVHNSQLRSIALREVLDWNITGLDHIAVVLSQIRSDHLELVELALLDRSIYDSDWSSLAGVFAKPQFTALRSIRIAARGLEPERVADVVRRNLPNCDERDLLSFPAKLDCVRVTIFMQNIIY